MEKLSVAYVNEIAQYITTIFKNNMVIVMSWGFDEAKASVYKDMASLEFSVSGFLYQGKVIVSYNQGVDYFEIFTFEKDSVKNHDTNICFDELVSKLDVIIETTDSKSESYHLAIKNNLAQVFV